MNEPTTVTLPPTCTICQESETLLILQHKLIAQLREDIKELNERLHERTQGFLRQSSPVK